MGDLRRWSWALIAGVLLSATSGYAFAEARNGEHLESRVGCLSARAFISCELDDGWTVSVPEDVVWQDDRGTHMGGRPSCLPPTGRGLEGPIELIWVPVDADGLGFRQVIWVGC